MDQDYENQFLTAASAMGYPVDALLFIVRGFSTNEIKAQTQIDCETLCWRLHDCALHLYGANARTQLATWGITTTSDFGKIVFGLAEHSLMRVSDTDKLTDFESVFDFEAQFEKPKYPRANPLSQWTLSSLFFVTTVAAVAMAGFSRSGTNGVWAALASSWFIILGVTCISFGIASRSPGWLILISFGAISFCLGLFAFLTFSYW